MHERFLPLFGWRAAHLLAPADPEAEPAKTPTRGIVGGLGAALGKGARALGAVDYPAYSTVDGAALPRPVDHAAWRQRLGEMSARPGDEGGEQRSASLDSSKSHNVLTRCARWADWHWLSETWLTYICTAPEDAEGYDGPELGGLTDEEGWQYAFHFGTSSARPEWSPSSDGCFVRRMHKVRLRQLGAPPQRGDVSGGWSADELWEAYCQARREARYRQSGVGDEMVGGGGAEASPQEETASSREGRE